jgi:predicted ArsR family transcriptional regulator
VELLELLRESDTTWSARAAAARLGIDEQVARRHLESLSARGLIRSSQAAAWRFATGRPLTRCVEAARS